MACAGVIAAAGLALTLASAEPVKFATEAPFPPYTLINAAGEIYGFERDLGDEVCARAHLTCSWQSVQFDQLLPGVMTGRFDVVLGGIAVTPERQRMVDFTMAYNESSDIDTLYGFDGAPAPESARVGVQSGTIQESHARKRGWNAFSYATEAEVLEALRAGKLDLAFGAYGDEPTETTGIFPLYEEQVPDMGTAMAVCRGNDDLLARLNAALQSMLKDGTIDELTARWL
jgi:polar amino acid transport system substrate-binding protein